jgi:hypothetical protein
LKTCSIQRDKSPFYFDHSQRPEPHVNILSLLKALRSTTVHTAVLKALGILYGVVDPQKSENLFLHKRNPLVSIDNAQKTSAVSFLGSYPWINARDDLLAEVKMNSQNTM